MSAEKRKAIELYCEGIANYKKREWKTASNLFARALSIDSSDYPSEIYLDRCRQYEIESPPPDWDGVFIMQTK